MGQPGEVALWPATAVLGIVAMSQTDLAARVFMVADRGMAFIGFAIGRGTCLCRKVLIAEPR